MLKINLLLKALDGMVHASAAQRGLAVAVMKIANDIQLREEKKRYEALTNEVLTKSFSSY